MTPVRMLIAGMTLGLISQAALAFQETKGAAPAGAAGDTAALAKGPEIRIPGLGAIGSLPKLDFGLELLYGASPAADQRNMREDKSENGDLQIRGTLKYRFPN